MVAISVLKMHVSLFTILLQSFPCIVATLEKTTGNHFDRKDLKLESQFEHLSATMKHNYLYTVI